VGPNLRLIRAIGLTLSFFVVIYLPASALVRILHLQLSTAVPLIMVLTLAVTAAVMLLMAARTPNGVAQYGFTLVAPRVIVLAALVSAPLAVCSALLLSRAHETDPLAGLSLPLWLVVLYFVVGAAVQEEVIFRGFLQTTLETSAAPPTAPSPKYGVAASFLVALLFGGIHLVVGRYTAAAAFILGATAGEFRRRSGSLIPAVICHAFFNLAVIIWP